MTAFGVAVAWLTISKTVDDFDELAAESLIVQDVVQQSLTALTDHPTRGTRTDRRIAARYSLALSPNQWCRLTARPDALARKPAILYASWRNVTVPRAAPIWRGLIVQRCSSVTMCTIISAMRGASTNGGNHWLCHHCASSTRLWASAPNADTRDSFHLASTQWLTYPPGSSPGGPQ